MASDLLVIGDCSIDQYMDVDDSMVLSEPSTNEEKVCFLLGSKVPVLKFNSRLAGNACHVGIGCQRLGIPTSIYTELGDDGYAQNFIDKFVIEGVDTTYCETNKGTNTNIHVIILHAGDRTIFSYHKPCSYKLPFETMSKPKWIYYTSLASGFEKFQSELASYLNTNPEIGLAFNPGSFQLKAGVDILREIISRTNILFVNKEEAYRILGEEPDQDIALKKLHEMLCDLGANVTVITDGKNGSSAYDGTQFEQVDAPELKSIVKNKTGAGDSYASAFLSAIYYKKSLKEALAWGNRNSASVIENSGWEKGLLTKTQIQ